jgi:hypothetical protein
MVAWVCPATTQFRSKVCPSTTVGDDDSILIGGETLGTGDRGGGTIQPKLDNSDGVGNLGLPLHPLVLSLALLTLTVGGATALDGDNE